MTAAWRLFALAAAVAALALAGCNQSGRPRPELGKPISPDAVAAAAAITPTSALGITDYTVIPGDTVYVVANRFKVPVRDMIEANALAPPYRLRPGQRLVVPARRIYVARAGDTIDGVSRLYGVDRSTLIRLNGIGEPYAIRDGQRLLLPAPVEPAGATVPTAAAAGPAPVAAVTAVELPPPTLAPAAPPAGVPAAPAPGAAPAPPVPGAPGDPPVAAPAEAETAAAAEYTTAPAIPTAIPQPPALSGGKFLWPVNGKIVSRFGATDGGLHNDGLNIAAPQGTPVRAAENGVVAYAGNELRGFGNLLLIRHADGWMSAYAHNDALLVQRGDRVARGQTIARVGRTGNVATPQLHFELRRGAGPVDPLPHLGDLGA